MKIFVLILLAVLASGCEQSELGKQKQKESDACIELGGVPVRSWLDGTVMSDCKFPPR